MSAVKRERCINWEVEEKNLLKEVLKPYIKRIENKNLSTNNNKEKQNAWSEITYRFNSINVRPRDKKQIINQWKCMKLASKKELMQYRIASTKTGGGPRPPTPSAESQEILELIPQEFTVDSNEFDSDGSMINLQSKSFTIIEESPTAVIDKINIVGTSKDIKESTLDAIMDTPHCLNKTQDKESPATSEVIMVTPHRPKRTQETKTNKKPKSFDFAEESFKDMHNYRGKENDRLQKEHLLRMKLMEEQHKQIMINLKLQEQVLVRKLTP